MEKKAKKLRLGLETLSRLDGVSGGEDPVIKASGFTCVSNCDTTWWSSYCPPRA
jgi:hypothetical protein